MPHRAGGDFASCGSPLCSPVEPPKPPRACKVPECSLIDYFGAVDPDSRLLEYQHTAQGEFAMRRKFRMELSEILELPMDISLDLPRVVIIGDLGVLIANHRGLMQYSTDRIVVGVGAGQITISGDNLEIEEVGQEQMAVRGVIKFVEMNTA